MHAYMRACTCIYFNILYQGNMVPMVCLRICSPRNAVKANTCLFGYCRRNCLSHQVHSTHNINMEASPRATGRISGELAASTHNPPGLGRALSAAEINDLAASRGNLSGSESVFCATACRTCTLRRRSQPKPWSNEGRTKHGCSITSPPVGHVPSLVVFFLNL